MKYFRIYSNVRGPVLGYLFKALLQQGAAESLQREPTGRAYRESLQGEPTGRAYRESLQGEPTGRAKRRIYGVPEKELPDAALAKIRNYGAFNQSQIHASI